MSDFFMNLAARTIAQPALRPRTRSRFEPAAIEERPLTWSRNAGVPPADQEASPPPPPPAHASEGVDAFVPAAEDGGVPVVQEVPVESIREVVRNIVEQRIAREVEHDVQRVIETNERIVRVPQRPHRFDREPPRIIERHLPREIEEVHRERETRTTIDRAPRVMRERSEAPQSQTAREPVIEVSIGRIEVRAVSSAPPARKETRDTTMTIDDYIARRKAKERR